MSASNGTCPVMNDLCDLHAQVGASNLSAAIAQNEVPWQPLPPFPAPCNQPVHSADVFLPDHGLTIKSLDEIFAASTDDSDMILGERMIARGQSCGLTGASGLGKSRLALAMACAMATGRNFLEFENHSGPLEVLILQTENSVRRLKQDFAALRAHYGCEWDLVSDNLRIQSPEVDHDYMLNLDDDDNIARISDTVASEDPDVLILDPLYAFAAGDLNKDADMKETCMAIGRIGRRGNAERAVLVLHHALTGRAGAAKATGYDRSSFGRNSKVFHAWTRAQINVAPGSADANDRLVLSCGKNSNGPEFETFGAWLNPTSMIYEMDPFFDKERWQAEVSGTSNPGSSFRPADVVGLLQSERLIKAKLVKAIQDESGCAKTHAYNLVNKAEAQNLISREDANKTYGPA